MPTDIKNVCCGKERCEELWRKSPTTWIQRNLIFVLFCGLIEISLDWETANGSRYESLTAEKRFQELWSTGLWVFMCLCCSNVALYFIIHEEFTANFLWLKKWIYEHNFDCISYIYFRALRASAPQHDTKERKERGPCRAGHIIDMYR